MSADLYIHGLVKQGRLPGQACLKIVNDANVELSLAFDDSCGSLPHLSRVSFMRFSAREALGEERPLYSAEEFLRVLADHLGYDLVEVVPRAPGSHPG